VSVDLDMAIRYRQHAGELRVVAERSPSADIRAILLKMAANYEQMADRLEAVDSTNKTMAKRLERTAPRPPARPGKTGRRPAAE
jgi:hypothetical protein